MVDVPKFSIEVISDPIRAANYFNRLKVSIEAIQQGEDGYGKWVLNTDGTFAKNFTSQEELNVIGGDNITVTFSGDDLTINSTSQALTASNGITLVGDDIQHDDTSAQIDIVATTDQVVSTVTFDTYGHVKTFVTRSLTPADIAAQPVDAGLTSISGLVTSADKMIYTTASDVYATTDITSFARTLLDDTTAAAMRTTLGLGTIATFAGNQDMETTDNVTFANIDLPIGGIIDLSGAGEGLSSTSLGRWDAFSRGGWHVYTDTNNNDASNADAFLVHTGVAQPSSSGIIFRIDKSGRIDATGPLFVDDTTDSTSTTTGSGQFDGGVGVVKNIVSGQQVATGGGATGSRPVSPVQFGMWFDTTLGHAIWHDGTNWVDATGATV